MTNNNDPQLPFILRRENIVRYKDGELAILDRRIYPFEINFVHCKTYEDTAKAIEDMVTQSGGPAIAAGYGMVQAVHQASNLSGIKIKDTLEVAAKRLIITRPTNNNTKLVVSRMLQLAIDTLSNGEAIEPVLIKEIDNMFEERHKFGMALGEAAATVIMDGDTILNHCWAESGIVYALYVALKQGKKIKAYCSETRPYLQGARLTADAIADMGISTTVITDGMSAHLMSRGMINSFFAGADRVTMDGHVINKIGTLTHAICAHNFDIPFYAFCFGPDKDAPTPGNVVIEERDPEEVLHCLGYRTATLKAKGYYPTFDITPPKFVSGIVTDKGIYSPYTLANYYKDNDPNLSVRFI